MTFWRRTGPALAAAAALALAACPTPTPTPTPAPPWPTDVMRQFLRFPRFDVGPMLAGS